MQNGCVSRIRRDNRYTLDKSLYRENMWIVLIGTKRLGTPCPLSSRTSPPGRQFRHGRLSRVSPADADPAPAPGERIRSPSAGLRKAEKAGFALSGDRYARPKKAGLPADIDSLYNRKWWDFSRMEPDPTLYADPTLPDILRQSMETLAPMYPADDPGRREEAGNPGTGGATDLPGLGIHTNWNRKMVPALQRRESLGTGPFRSYAVGLVDETFPAAEPISSPSL